jgi:hypothetical protein
MTSWTVIMAPACALLLWGCQWFASSPVGTDGGSDDGEEDADLSADELVLEGKDGLDGSEGQRCPEPLTLCDGVCVDLQSDPDHCGGCGTACTGEQVCSEGDCVAACGEGLTNCSGACVDLSVHPLNCGRCGRECPGAEGADPVCEDFDCKLVCLPGLWDIDGEPGCEYACTPTASEEACDGLDNDCNGATDEAFECVYETAVSCTTACGTEGSGTCTDRCELPRGALCLPPDEICNGQDDNCDGHCDEPADCCAGTGWACVNACGVGGSQICTDRCAAGPCCGPIEVCGNACDDDCDGTACHDVVITMTADNRFEAYLDGAYLGDGSMWEICYTFSQQLLTGTHVLAFHATDEGGVMGAIAGIYADGGFLFATGAPGWKVIDTPPDTAWTSVGYDDSSWVDPVACTGPWGSCPDVVADGGSWVWYPPGCAGSVPETWYRGTFALP